MNIKWLNGFDGENGPAGRPQDLAQLPCALRVCIRSETAARKIDAVGRCGRAASFEFGAPRLERVVYKSYDNSHNSRSKVWISRVSRGRRFEFCAYLRLFTHIRKKISHAEVGRRKIPKMEIVFPIPPQMVSEENAVRCRETRGRMPVLRCEDANRGVRRNSTKFDLLGVNSSAFFIFCSLSRQHELPTEGGGAEMETGKMPVLRELRQLKSHPNFRRMLVCSVLRQ